MIITNRTIVTFGIPEEDTAAKSFNIQHKDWNINYTSQAISFEKYSAYRIDMAEQLKEQK